MAVSEELHAELAQAAVSAATPEPTRFVRVAQLILAAVSLGGAMAIALILVLGGPPAPKEPTGAESAESASAVEGEAKSNALSGTGATATTLVGDATGEAEAEGGEATGSNESTEGGEAEGGSSEGGAEDQSGEEEAEGGGESLADLSKQGPWAFAIVALLVGAFIATGKSLNFSGKST
jgi:hypothetical protein